MRITSVRMRLALWNVGILALTLAMFGVALRYTNQDRLTKNMDRVLDARAGRLLGEQFARDDGPPPRHHRPPFRLGEWAPGDPGPGDHAPPDWGWVRPRPEGWGPESWGPGAPPPHHAGPFGPRIQYFDTTGRPLSGRPGEHPLDPSGFAAALGTRQPFHSTAPVLQQPFRVLSVPLLHNGQLTGVAQLALPLSDVYDELGRLTRTQLTLIPLALLAAALGGLFLTERALRPVREMTQAAARIGAGSDNFGFRISDFGLGRRSRSDADAFDFTGNPKSKNQNPKSPQTGLSERLPVEGQDELSELAATFNGMLARLEQAFTQLALALEQQRRFTADASHELRTPLTIIKAHTSLALEEERTNREYRRALTAADRAADTTTRIVQDLLLLARADAGQLRPEAPGTREAGGGSARRALRIHEVLQAAAEAFQGPDLAPIALDTAEPSLAVPGDPTHLLRLFSNLLENAVRHTPPTGQIAVGVYCEAGGIRVEVRDTGEGIPAEHLPHVCERFYRVDAARTRQQGGTGLGLAICRSIVEAHGGSLSIASTVGQGTTVTVFLPGPVSSVEASAAESS